MDEKKDEIRVCKRRSKEGENLPKQSEKKSTMKSTRKSTREGKRGK